MGIHRGLRVPPQRLSEPTFFPYNERTQSRRLDYVLLRGTLHSKTSHITEHRDMVSSDREAVSLEIQCQGTRPEEHNKVQCGPRPLRLPPPLESAVDQQLAIHEADFHAGLMKVAFDLPNRDGGSASRTVRSSRSSAALHIAPRRGLNAAQRGRRFPPSAGKSTERGAMKSSRERARDSGNTAVLMQGTGRPSCTSTSKLPLQEGPHANASPPRCYLASAYETVQECGTATVRQKRPRRGHGQVEK